jgi:PTH1 family peptidyl-tRNA hydrolase
MIKALIGLGNEGREYEKTYHNVGDFVSREIAGLAEKEGVHLKVYKISGFMNESGINVLPWIKKNGLKLEDVLVVHDEGDLSVGNFKISKENGSAGHNGIKSLIDVFGTESFLRLRVGIRDANEQVRRKTGEFVLNKWNNSEEVAFKDVAKKAFEELARQ